MPSALRVEPATNSPIWGRNPENKIPFFFEPQGLFSSAESGEPLSGAPSAYKPMIVGKEKRGCATGRIAEAAA